MTAFLSALLNIQNEDHSLRLRKKRRTYGGKLVPSVLILASGEFVSCMNDTLPFLKFC